MLWAELRGRLLNERGAFHNQTGDQRGSGAGYPPSEPGAASGGLLACGTAAIDLQQMALDGEVGFAGQVGEQVAKGATLEGDDRATIGADEMMQVARPADDIARLGATGVDAGEPASTVQLIDGAIDGSATGGWAIGLKISIELFGAKGGGIVGDAPEEADTRLGHALVGRLPGRTHRLHPGIGIDAHCG